MNTQVRRRRPKRRRPVLPLGAAVLLLTLALTGGRALLTPGAGAEPGPADAALPPPPPPACASGGVPAVAPEKPRVLPDPARPGPSPAPAPDGEEGADGGTFVPEREAEEGWFDDAAFLGDSLTDGLLLYSGIRGADNLSYQGLTVQSVRTDRVIRAGEGKTTPLEALGRKTYGKVYLLLGVNELGWYNDQRFYDCYGALVDEVRKIQPGAQIYLQTLLPVAEEKIEGRDYLTNAKIEVYNDLIAALAEEKGVYCVDAHAALTDERGALPPEMSTDGVHLTRAAYETWLEYLKNHTVSPQ